MGYHEILQEFYSKYKIDRTADIPILLVSYKGEEGDLIHDLFVKYSANPMDFDFFKNYIDGNFKEYLSAFYSKHNPAKLNEVNALVEKFKGKKEVFLNQLCSRYNIETCSLIDYIDIQKNEEERIKPIESTHKLEKIAPGYQKNGKRPENEIKVTEVKGQQPIEYIQPKHDIKGQIEKDKKINSKNKISLFHQKKVIWVLSIIIGLIICTLFFAIFSSYISLQNAKELEQQRITDSIRFSDSLALVKSYQQQMADSIAIILVEKQRIDDSTAKVQEYTSKDQKRENISSSSMASRQLNSVETEIYKKFGLTGLRIYNLRDSKTTDSEIIKMVGCSQAKLSEILEYMSQHGFIKLERQK